MLKYLLMLKYLGIDGGLINFMAKEFSSSEFDELFKGAILELQFKYNIFSDKVINLLGDINKLTEVEEFVDKILYRNRELGIQIVSYFDSDYPTSLRKIYKKPMFIHVKGNMELLKKIDAVACVGSRKPTEIAKASVKSTVKSLVENDNVIVSGLALGIDTLSHKICLENSGETIGVLAHGLDTIYPKENINLAEKILNNGGALISEYPVFSQMKKGNFVSRNRIISGLSKAVIIFEANESSGTMHTARFAYKDKRKIFCPTFEKNGELSTGVIKLLNSRSATNFSSPQELISKLSPKEQLTINLDKSILNKINKLASEKNTSLEDFIEKTLTNYINNNII